MHIALSIPIIFSQRKPLCAPVLHFGSALRYVTFLENESGFDELLAEIPHPKVTSKVALFPKRQGMQRG